jgi:hypothetical protein
MSFTIERRGRNTMTQMPNAQLADLKLQIAGLVPPHNLCHSA